MGEKIQQFILILRKLGILRYGVTKYKYTSGRDMPAQALFDDVYDVDKDLVSREDFRKIARMLNGKKGAVEVRYCTQCGKNIDPVESACPFCGALTSR